TAWRARRSATRSMPSPARRSPRRRRVRPDGCSHSSSTTDSSRRVVRLRRDGAGAVVGTTPGWMAPARANPAESRHNPCPRPEPRIRAIALAVLTMLAAHAAAAEKLTIARLFADPGLSGPAPRALRIAPDGVRVTFLRGKDAQ